MGKKEKHKEKEKQTEPVKERIPQGSNPRVEEIIADYPDSIHEAPRTYFEEQLRKHLLKHKVQ